MARYLYSATPADYVVNAATGLPVPSAVVTVWTTRTGGSQITDLQNLSGGAITQVTADAQGFIAFYCPDGMTDNVWLYSGSGPRLLARTVENFATQALAALKLDKAGGTLTGALTLSGAPTLDLHAATKKYVDDHTTGAFVSKAGDTLTGDLVIANSADFFLGATGGPRAQFKQQTDYPLIVTPYNNAGSALGSANLYYSIPNTRWQIESGLKVEGTLTMDGTKVTGLAAATDPTDAVRFSQVSAIMGSWANYSATLTASGSTPAGWTVSTRYTQINDTVIYSFELICTNAASVGTGIYLLTLPVGAALNFWNPMSTVKVGSGVGTYSGAAQMQSATAIQFTVWFTGEAETTIQGTTPITWVTNDSIVGTIIYEAA